MTGGTLWVCLKLRVCSITPVCTFVLTDDHFGDFCENARTCFSVTFGRGARALAGPALTAVSLLR